MRFLYDPFGSRERSQSRRVRQRRDGRRWCASHAALGLMVSIAVACGARVEPPPRALPGRPVAVARLAPGQQPASEETNYWEPYAIALGRGPTQPRELPVEPAQLRREGPAKEAFSRLADQGGLLHRGFSFGALRPPVESTSAGGGQVPAPTSRADVPASLATWAEVGIPVFVGFDLLASLAVEATSRLVGEAERHVVLPRFQRTLGAVDATLRAGMATTSPELMPAYVIAYRVIAVAQALLDPGHAMLPEHREAVSRELAAIAAHERRQASPVLLSSVDYTIFASLPAPADEMQRAAYAATWLSVAPLSLVARTEMPAAELLVGDVRHHARAALLLARAIDPAVDPQAAADARLVFRFYRFLFGRSDELGIDTLTQVATRLSYPISDPRTLLDVTRVERLRHVAARQHRVEAPDGSTASRQGPASFELAPTLRVLAPASTPEGPALWQLSLVRQSSPVGLDVAAWLGSDEARRLAMASTDPRRAPYDQTLDQERLAFRKLPPNEHHESVYDSFIETLSTYLGPSQGDDAGAPLRSEEWGARRVETALATWALLRARSTYFGRPPVVALPPTSATPPSEPGFRVVVEAHPEALVQLLATLAQAQRGLTQLGVLPAASAAQSNFAELEDVLRSALSLAVLETEDQPVPAELRESVRRIPTRVAQLAKGLLDADVPYALARTYHDVRRKQVSLVGVSSLTETAWLVREPAEHFIHLAFGASLTFGEAEAPAPRMERSLALQQPQFTRLYR
jgi:hypothetical protein